MILTRLLASAALIPGAALVNHATVNAPVTSATAAPMRVPEPARPALPRPPRLPGFAADLAQQPAIVGPAAWGRISQDDAWMRLSRAPQPERQQARWNYARSLIGQERGQRRSACWKSCGRTIPTWRWSIPTGWRKGRR